MRHKLNIYNVQLMTRDIVALDWTPQITFKDAHYMTSLKYVASECILYLH